MDTDTDNLRALLSALRWSDTFTEAVYDLDRGLLHYGEFREAVVAEMAGEHTPAEMLLFGQVLRNIDDALDECAAANQLDEQIAGQEYHYSYRTLVHWYDL